MCINCCEAFYSHSTTIRTRCFVVHASWASESSLLDTKASVEFLPILNMTKRKSSDEWEGSEWLSAQFPPPALPSSGSSCDYCLERFGFFWWMSGGRKTCHFCGYQIHSRCSSIIANDNGKKIRICQRCRKYKYDSSKLLVEGN